MPAALCRLTPFPNVTIIPTVSEPQSVSSAIRAGQPADHLPILSPSDVVYAAGSPAMTERVARIAKAAGTKCYTDPFTPNAKLIEQKKLAQRVTGWLNQPSRNFQRIVSR